MNENTIRALILEGENSWIEFKRCGNGIESDVYETVCSFSNHFGGTILCGVLDDGSIQGISEKAICPFLLYWLTKHLFWPVIDEKMTTSLLYKVKALGY